MLSTTALILRRRVSAVSKDEGSHRERYFTH